MKKGDYKAEQYLFQTELYTFFETHIFIFRENMQIV